jgi:hypothetical protein
MVKNEKQTRTTKKKKQQGKEVKTYKTINRLTGKPLGPVPLASLQG